MKKWKIIDANKYDRRVGWLTVHAALFGFAADMYHRIDCEMNSSLAHQNAKNALTELDNIKTVDHKAYESICEIWKNEIKEMTKFVEEYERSSAE